MRSNIYLSEGKLEKLWCTMVGGYERLQTGAHGGGACMGSSDPDLGARLLLRKKRN